MMRRLPVFFVVDVSESMVGKPIRKVEEGLRTIIAELKKDPHALETVYISIIVFAGRAKTLVPLTDVVSFYAPKFSIGAGTNYGDVLKHTISEIQDKTKQTNRNEKGDWKPIIFFLTDGNPTDNYIIDLGVWEQIWKDKTNTIVISIGDHADHSILNRISNNILTFDESDDHSYMEFFKWVTASLKTQSQQIDDIAIDSDIPLSGFDTNRLKKIEAIDKHDLKEIDDLFAIFHGKCQQTEKEYLIKYKKRVKDIPFSGMSNLKVENYRLEGAYILDHNYKELSTGTFSSTMNSVNSDSLTGIPSCPICSNVCAMAICSCSKIFCLNGLGQQTCPHCGKKGFYGEGNLNIDRQQG